MRRLIGFLILLLVVGCKSNVKVVTDLNTCLITGTYHSSDSLLSSLLLASYNLVPEEYNNSLIQLDSVDSFKITIPIEYPQSLTILGRKSIGPMMSSQALGFFIFPGDTLDINFSDSIVIKCSNFQHQKFIQNYIKLADSIQTLRNGFPFQESVKNDSPEEFILKQITFRHLVREKVQLFIDVFNIKDLEFEEMAFREAEYIMASHLIDYKLLNEIIYKRKMEFPKAYFAIADSLTNSINEKLITYNYFNFLNRLQILHPTEKIDSLLRFLNYNSNTLTQDILLGRSLISLLNMDSLKTATKYLDDYKTKINSSFIRKVVEEQYERKLAFINNPKARNAFLIDLSQKTADNSVLKQIIHDQKGRVIYIKFWGPWCGPCMEELPFDKMLISKLNPDKFAFVNLCIKTKKEDWECTISNKKIPGYHYFLNDNQYNELASTFNITGIPYHILIGKDGKLLDNNASSPGSVLINGLDQVFVDKLQKLCETDY